MTTISNLRNMMVEYEQATALTPPAAKRRALRRSSSFASITKLLSRSKPGSAATSRTPSPIPFDETYELTPAGFIQTVQAILQKSIMQAHPDAVWSKLSSEEKIYLPLPKLDIDDATIEQLLARYGEMFLALPDQENPETILFSKLWQTYFPAETGLTHYIGNAITRQIMEGSADDRFTFPALRDFSKQTIAGGQELHYREDDIDKAKTMEDVSLAPARSASKRYCPRSVNIPALLTVCEALDPKLKTMGAETPYGQYKNLLLSDPSKFNSIQTEFYGALSPLARLIDNYHQAFQACVYTPFGEHIKAVTALNSQLQLKYPTADFFTQDLQHDETTGHLILTLHHQCYAAVDNPNRIRNNDDETLRYFYVKDNPNNPLSHPDVPINKEVIQQQLANDTKHYVDLRSNTTTTQTVEHSSEHLENEASSPARYPVCTVIARYEIANGSLDEPSRNYAGLMGNVEIVSEDLQVKLAPGLACFPQPGKVEEFIERMRIFTAEAKAVAAHAERSAATLQPNPPALPHPIADHLHYQPHQSVFYEASAVTGRSESKDQAAAPALPKVSAQPHDGSRNHGGSFSRHKQ